MKFSPLLALCFALVFSLPSKAEETRIFKNEFGSVEVPVNPKCVISLHDFSLSIQLMELGIRPCGSVARKKLWKPPYYRGLEHRFNTEDINYVGSHSTPDIEAIAALNPDLIVGLSYQKKWVEKLSLIAPVVILPVREESTVVWARQLADIVGKTTVFENQKKEYDWILSEFKRLVPNAMDITVTTLELYKNNFQLIGRGGLDDVINDMGLERVDAYHKAKKGVNYSLEKVSDFNSDIIIDTYEPLLDSREDTESFRQSLQWKNLFAVKNKQFLYFNRSRFGESMGGLKGSAYLLLSHVAERELIIQKK